MSFRSWIELESDPGLFSLLVYDFGVKGVEVEEVYDLSKPIERSVYGFIFLFKWTEERKTRRKAAVPEENFVLDESIENDMFFAQQLIPNSCASHALLSVLLNVPDVSLGYTLKQLRDSCKGFDSETKGHAIGNFWNIAVAHNNHGRPELRCHADRSKNVTASRSMEAFHYVSYIPCNGRLFELDGLKPHPIDHGPWRSDETWSDKARKVIQDRIRLATGGELSHDIRYNLLAVVPEQRDAYKEKMEILNHNKKVLIEVFKKLACKQSFVVEAPTNSILKQTDRQHPFPEQKLLKRKRKSKSVSFNDRVPLSPKSHSSSTLSGNESERHMMSDSEDGSVDTYRVKSIMRGKPPVVYVYGEDTEEKPNEESTDQTEQTTAQKDTENETIDNLESDTAKKQKFGEGLSNDSSSSITPDGHMKLEEVTNNENNMDTSSDQQEHKNTSDTDIKNEHSDKTNKLDSTTSSAELSSEGNTEATEPEIATETVSTGDGGVTEEEDAKEQSVQPGVGVEIFADDVDIHALLAQKNITKLSLDHVLKYEDKITLSDLQKCMQDLDEFYNAYQTSYKEELEKLERYKIDDCRRRHNYEPFVATFLSMLAEQGHLTKLLEQQSHANHMKKLAKAAFQKKDAANKKKKKVRRK